ncbi:MAG: formylglycine-generating enzyme family protein, partial [Planctomycetia bacterium]
VELRKDRPDLAKIRGQLRERRDGAMALVKAAMDGGDVRQAAALIAGFAAEDWGKEGASLMARVSRAAALEAKLARAVAAVKADGGVMPEKARRLLVMCEEYLRLNPRGAGVRELAKRCRDIVTPSQFTNSLGMKLKLLPAGTFTMGQAGGDADESPHQVTLTNPFYMGVYAVTHAQWKRVMGGLLDGSQDDDRPVERVSWRDAVEFCEKLSALPEEKQAGRSYRLPTEAEWEYACRAGATTDYSFGDDAAGLGEYAWHAGNAGNQTHPVGQKKPNAWGLYDMHGNVWEWVNDGYDSGYYARSPGSNPTGPSAAPIRVVRGGSSRDHARFCRSAFRIGRDPSYRDLPLGFRVALSPP